MAGFYHQKGLCVLPRETVAGVALFKWPTSNNNLISVVNAIRSLLAKVNTLLSSITVFKLSIHLYETKRKTEQTKTNMYIISTIIFYILFIIQLFSSMDKLCAFLHWINISIQNNPFRTIYCAFGLISYQ